MRLIYLRFGFFCEPYAFNGHHPGKSLFFKKKRQQFLRSLEGRFLSG